MECLLCGDRHTLNGSLSHVYALAPFLLAAAVILLDHVLHPKDKRK